MLGYRTYFEVDEGATGVLDEVMSQLHAWLRAKGYDADSLQQSQQVTIAPDVTAGLLAVTRVDHSRDIRFRLVERKEGPWVTQLTIHASANSRNRSWVWLDVDSPDLEGHSTNRRWVATPRLAGALLDVLEARDGEARLTARPTPVGLEDVEGLAEMICDERRRGLLFVAGCADHGSPDPGDWSRRVTAVLHQTVGIAGSFVMDAPATAELGQILTESHGVRPGTIRTFLPGADPASEGDALRHRVLGAGRIADDDPRHLGKMLGWRARDAALDSPLPSSAIRLDRELSRLYDDMLLSSAFRSGARDAETITLPTEPAAAAERSADRRVRARDSKGDRLLDRVRTVVRGVFGPVELTVNAIDELGVLAMASAGTRESQQALRQRLDDLQTHAESLQDQHQILTERLEDEVLDHAQDNEDLRSLRATVTMLRKELVDAGEATRAWQTHDAPVAPRDFAELLDRVDELENVDFTGNADVTLSLNNLYSYVDTWSAKAWDAMLALDNYAALKRSGQVSGSVREYLRNTPAGCHGYSATRHASDESEDVKSNRKFNAARHLPVPTAVRRSGKQHMYAHFKIAQYKLVSPRLHYFDDTHRSGKIYVGHLGPHLPTKQTN